MKKSFAFLSVVALLVAVASCLKPRQDNINYYNQHTNKAVNQSQDLVINELCAHSPTYLDNDTTPAQAFHWVELYNPGDSTIYFANTKYYMTSDSTNPGMYKLNEFNISPKGFAIVITDDPQVTDVTHMHANFHTSKTGGFVGLYKLTDSGYVALTKHIYTADNSNESEGRLPDNGTTWYYFSTPSPLQTNTSGVSVDSMPAQYQ